MKTPIMLAAVAALSCGGTTNDDGPIEVSESYRMEPECVGAIDQQLWSDADPPGYACYWACVEYLGEPYVWLRLSWRLGHYGWELNSALGDKGECH